MVLASGRRLLGVFAVILLATLTLLPADASASTVVPGVSTVNNMLLVVDGDGSVVGVYPSDLHIVFDYTRFYEDEFVNSSVVYTIKECEGGWVLYIPPTTFYVPEVDGIIKLERPSLSVACYANAEDLVEGNTTRTSAGVAVKVSVRIGVTVVKLGSKDISVLHIGEYIHRYVMNWAVPTVAYRVFVEKDVNGYKHYAVYQEWLNLDLTTVEVGVYVVGVWLNKVSLRGYVERGNFSTGGVVLSPIYDVEVCGELSGVYRMRMSMIVSVSEREVILNIPPGGRDCKTIVNATFSPGANQTIVLSARTGALSITLRYEGVNVSGLVVSISKPFGRVVASGALWTCVIQSLVSLTGYYSPFPRVSVRATVSNRFFGSFDCLSPDIAGEGTYSVVCEKTVSGNFDWSEIENSNFRFEIAYTDERGKTWSYAAEVRVVVTDPSSIAGQMAQVYNTVLNILLSGLLVTIVLLIISYIKEMFTGSPLIDPYLLRGALLTLIVSFAVLSVGVPTVYYAFGKIVENLPILNRYISPPTSTEPTVVFGQMISYYDKLFTTILRDYEVEFVGSIGKIMSWLQMTTAVALALMVVALALSTIWTPGAGIPFSSIASGIMSLVFGIISMLMMQVQMGVFAVVAVTISRVMIFVVSAVILSFMMLGTMMICIPSSTIQRIGEDLFGAGVLYTISFPLIAPLSYAIYMHLMDTVRMQGALEAIGNICINVPIPICYIGFVPFLTRMIAFVVASGVATLLILGTLGYILSRTGVAAGIGEALSSMVWRG